MRALFPGAAQWLLVIWVVCFVHDVTSRPSTSQSTQSTPTNLLSTASIALEKNNNRYKHKEINKKHVGVDTTLVFNNQNNREGKHIQKSNLKNLKGKRNIFKVVPSVNVKEHSENSIDVLRYDQGNVSREFDEGLNNRNVSYNILDDFLLKNSSSVHDKNKTVRTEPNLVLPVELAGYNEEGVVNAVGVQMRWHANNNKVSLRYALDDPPEKKVIKHRVKRNRMEQVDKPIFSERFPDSNNDPRTLRQQRLMDIRDKQVFHNFLQQSITDLQNNAEHTEKTIIQLDHKDPNLFSSERRKHGQQTSNNDRTRGTKYNLLKRWPDSAITTAEELENYQNYTSLNFDESNLNPDVMTFNKWDTDSNAQEVSVVNNKRNQSMHNYGAGTSSKKPVIHQVLTKWSDTPNFDNLKNPWQKITNEDQYLDEITLNEFRPDDTSTSNEQIVSNEYITPTLPTFDTTEMSNINYLATKRTPSYDDGAVVYIRPKPNYFNQPAITNYNNGVSISSTRKPTTPPHDLFKRPLRNKNKNKHKNPSYSSTLPSLIYTLNPGILSSVPFKAVTPSYSSDDGSKPSYRPTNNVNIYDPNKPDPDEINFPDKDFNSDPATHIIVQDDCPTVYVTINNTVQSEAKEGCADIHLLINSNVLQSNVLIEDPVSIASDAAFDPVFENDSSYPVLPVAPVVAGDVPVVEGTNSVVPLVPLAASPVVGNAVPGGGQSPLASPGISSVATNSAGFNPGLSLPSLNPPPGIGSLSNFVSGGDSPDDEEDSIGSWIHSATGVLAWMTFLNPLNYGIFSLFLAPLVILVAGGAGLAALLAPWLWSMESYKTKRVVVIEEPTRWYWAWDPSYKTWNWAPYPDYGRDWGTSDSEIVESSIVKIANSNDDEPEYVINEMVSNVGGNVRKWVSDIYGNIVGARRLSKRKKRSTNSIEDWKKRRK